ncbi:MAG: hypothetical protein CMM74_09395 [Rhodospirillaceae bacterium]|nr:hypothetical protein [Rhodospirillaceae bacterium]|tara:strand:+ start:1261 stop:1476 length:216 start_codon:yes stop_codon:yes gene_type:complete
MRFMRTSTRIAIKVFVFSLISFGPIAKVVGEVVMTDTAEIESAVTPTSTSGVKKPNYFPFVFVDTSVGQTH